MKVTCAADCRYSAKLTLARGAAKKLGLSRKVAKASGKASAGRAKTVTLKLSGREARKLEASREGAEAAVVAGGAKRTVGVKTR